MSDAGPQDTLQCRVDLRQQAPNPVRELVHLGDEVVVEAAEHRQFRDLLISQLQRPQRMRQGSSGVGDDRCVRACQMICVSGGVAV
jgi:hypothetical protein